MVRKQEERKGKEAKGKGKERKEKERLGKKWSRANDDTHCGEM